MDFLRLRVDYVWKTFAAGKIPGGFFKREGRASDKEVLTSRMTDRPIGPLFPKGYCREPQIITTVLSADRDNDPDMLSLIAASAALLVSDIPHKGPVASVRMGRVEGKIVVNPTHTELEGSDVSLVVAASPESIMMLEGGAQIVDEEVILEALFAAHEAMQPIFAMQEELQRRARQPTREFAATERHAPLLKPVDTSIR